MDETNQVSEKAAFKCYTCAHRFYSDANGYNPYCENRCGDYYQGYEPEDEDVDG